MTLDYFMLIEDFLIFPSCGYSESGSPKFRDPCIHIMYYIFLRQSTFYIALHCTQTRRLRKEWKYILIHNNTLQSLIKYCIKHPCFHFENWIFLFVVSLEKWLVHFLLQKRWRNEGFIGTSDMPLYKWRVTWNYACIPFKYSY